MDSANFRDLQPGDSGEEAQDEAAAKNSCMASPVPQAKQWPRQKTLILHQYITVNASEDVICVADPADEEIIRRGIGLGDSMQT